MKKFLLPASFVAIVTLTACTGNPPSDTNSVAQPYSTAPAPVPTPLGDTTGSTISPPGSIVTTPSPTMPAATAVQPKPSANAGALNPAHGQPGHRCDINVGAPLNSAPNQTQQQAAPIATKPAASGGSVKLNPAHGQPGHDCAVPVGQPLKG